MKSSEDLASELAEFPSLVDTLRRRAFQQPDKTAFIFLEDGESIEKSISYSQLDRRARAIAKHLHSRSPQGERAVLLYPAGIDFIAAFFGCLYAGIIAVPAYPPDPRRALRSLPRLLSIILDCRARFVLTSSEISSMADNV
ncbi:MAG: AMP-binding protein, partial [Polyangiaceae bacterium]|nr:AMP-binding protein [Polyangiaceae bacterium]